MGSPEPCSEGALTQLRQEVERLKIEVDGLRAKANSLDEDVNSKPDGLGERVSKLEKQVGALNTLTIVALLAAIGAIVLVLTR